jgi:flavodoxin
MKILIAFASKSRSAQKLSEHIAAGCRAAGAEPVVLDLKDSYRFADYLPLRPILGRREGRATHDLSSYGLLFIGFEIHNASESSNFLDFVEHNDFSGKRVAIFCSYFVNRKYLERIIRKFEGKRAEVFNTLSLKRKGLSAFIGLGNLDENDLVRAEAFAERAVNNTLGRKVWKDSEKAQIKGYRK